MCKKVSFKKAVITNCKGIHARVAAYTVQKANEIQNKYKVLLHIQKGNYEKIPLCSFMVLVSMKIKMGEEVLISAVGENPDSAVEEMAEFIKGNFEKEEIKNDNDVDNLLQDSVLTTEQIFNNLANGLIAIDEKELITIFNPVAERIFGLEAAAVIGKKFDDIIQGSSLVKVLRSQKSEIGTRQRIGNSVIISNNTPIMVEGECKGALCIFEDISKFVKVSWELTEIKELKKKYELILKSVQEGICFVDKEGFITYVNSAYSNILGQSEEELIGQNVWDIAPEGARVEVLSKGTKIFNYISTKENGVTIVANVNPIVVDGEVLGAVSVVKDITELKKLSEKLTKVSAKAEYLEQELKRTKKLGPAFDRIIGRSGKLMDAMAVAAKASESRYTVLIRGESGTGKELVAEAIHYSSSRLAGPFIRVNCAAIPPALLESEFFGHEKGAFTGAVKTKLGKFELANKGTIFLDEIGEMERNMQSKLLRVIQQKEFQRVGGEDTLKTDVRIIAATNQNLEELVSKGEFREDLYYRLNVLPILLPALRDKTEDIPLLTEFFINKVSSELNKELKGISPDAVEVLMRYNWPGNVRELENVLERTITMLEGNFINVGDLPQYLRGALVRDRSLKDNSILNSDGIILPWEDYERIIIKAALEKYGSYNSAGKALGLTHKTVAAKAQKYGIEKSVAWEKVSD